MEKSIHDRGHVRASKGLKTVPRAELLKHPDSSER